MATIAALVLGAATGVVGFIPILLARQLPKQRNAALRNLAIPLGLGCVLVSLAILMVALFVAAEVAAEEFLYFGVALVLAFLTANVVLAVRLLCVRKK